MKKSLLLTVFLALLTTMNSAQSIQKSDEKKNSQPITTQGISLPQLITTNINRSTLTHNFRVNRFGKLDLSSNFGYFKSDKNKQITASASLVLTKNIDDISEVLSKGHTLRTNLNLNAKFFNSKDYFLEFETNNNGNRFIYSPISFGSLNQSYSLGIGKGRIDYLTDGAVALQLIKSLEKIGAISKSLNEDQIIELKDKIAELKNERRFSNRTYSLTEVTQIKKMLDSFGVLNANINIESIINDNYKYEPLIERTTGSQFRIRANFRHPLLSAEDRFTTQSKGINISYATHRYQSEKLQLNSESNLYLSRSNVTINNELVYKYSLAGISHGFDLHYLINNKSRISFKTNVGYNFVNRYFDQRDPNSEINRPEWFINYGFEYEFRTSRQTAVTLGLNGDIRKNGSYSGLSLGIKF